MTTRLAALLAVLVLVVIGGALLARSKGSDSPGNGNLGADRDTVAPSPVTSSTSTTSMAVPSTTTTSMPVAATTSVPPTATMSTTTSSAPATTVTDVVAVSHAGTLHAAQFVMQLRVESRIQEVSTEDFGATVMSTLNDERGWNRAGVHFEIDPASALMVVLANPEEVDDLCLPLRTRGEVSCQNGEVVALNAERWLTGPQPDKGWDQSLGVYQQYLINHEVGHLFGLRHPTSRCPTPATRAAVMEQQTGGLVGCTGNGFPLDWEIEWAQERPATIGPLPSWEGPRPTNPGDR